MGKPRFQRKSDQEFYEAKSWGTVAIKDAKTKQSLASRIMNGVLSFANAIAYYESTILKRVRLTATAVHITARKRGR